MPNRKRWSRQELLIAFWLYCQMPFGKLHSRNPDIIKYAKHIGRTPSALAMKLNNIASLDPAIVSTGRKGLSGASSADKKMWNEMQQDWEGFALETENEISCITIDTSLTKNSVDPLEKAHYAGSEKEVKTKVRIGQHFFRRSVLSAYNYKCCITGLAVPSLLVASHIVPWRSDVKNRLNPKNGLSLSIIHDKAFDLGIITVNDDMTIRVSEGFASENDCFFQMALKSYENKPVSLPEKFAPDIELLSYHRKHIFQR